MPSCLASFGEFVASSNFGDDGRVSSGVLGRGLVVGRMLADAILTLTRLDQRNVQGILAVGGSGPRERPLQKSIL